MNLPESQKEIQECIKDTKLLIERIKKNIEKYQEEIRVNSLDVEGEL